MTWLQTQAKKTKQQTKKSVSWRLDETLMWTVDIPGSETQHNVMPILMPLFIRWIVGPKIDMENQFK